MNRCDSQVITVRADGDNNLSYLVRPKPDGGYVCIDPSYGGDDILKELQRLGGCLDSILLTHAHGDHISDVGILVVNSGAAVYQHHAENRHFPGAREIGRDGAANCPCGVEAIITPGHTPGSTCYRIGDNLFTGDTLFVDWIGRCDFTGGDPAAMFESLKRLRVLPDDLSIYPGHDYGCVPSRSLGEEKRLNRFLACESYVEFLKLLPELV